MCSYGENLEPENAEEVINSLEALILILTCSEKKYPKHLRIALKCAVRLCEAKPDYCETFIDLLGMKLTHDDGM